MPFISIMTSDNIVSTDGLRGIVPYLADDSIGQNPYLEFVYDNDRIPVAGFESDDMMFDYLIMLRNEVLNVITVE
jgi:hypothetical protein